MVDFAMREIRKVFLYYTTVLSSVFVGNYSIGTYCLCMYHCILICLNQGLSQCFPYDGLGGRFLVVDIFLLHSIIAI